MAEKPGLDREAMGGDILKYSSDSGETTVLIIPKRYTQYAIHKT
ncbi:MAG: hypothetical protein SGJ10_05515 [Bacteroidota bacterium]|nr:hypothetical protein [Bacteroidota bacterium]